MGESVAISGSRALPEQMARDYIADMLEELSGIARRAGLSELDAVLSVARLATRQD